MTWLQLANRTAIVTGAGSGIGKSTSIALYEQGCHVILADIDNSKCDDTAHEIITKNQPKYMDKDIRPPTIRTIPCDVTVSSQVKHLIETADQVSRKSMMTLKQKENNPHHRHEFSIPDLASILVNCAGITRDNFLSKMNEDDFDHVINVNLKGTFLTSKYFCEKHRLDNFKSLQSRASDNNVVINTTATIINFGSVVGSYGNIGQTNYAASKGGVTSLTRTIAKEVAPFGVRANTILPGFINTPMIETVPHKVQQKIIDHNLFLKRFGTTDDIANLCLFLASETRSGYITGQAIECSGMVSL